MAKQLTLLNRFDRLNRRHFRGRLKRPVMVRFSKQPDPDDLSAVGLTITQDDGRACILIHEALRPFNPLAEFVLLHEMTHHQDGCVGGHGDKFHKKMLSILKKEPWLC